MIGKLEGGWGSTGLLWLLLLLLLLAVEHPGVELGPRKEEETS